MKRERERGREIQEERGREDEREEEREHRGEEGQGRQRGTERAATRAAQEGAGGGEVEELAGGEGVEAGAGEGKGETDDHGPVEAFGEEKVAEEQGRDLVGVVEEDEGRGANGLLYPKSGHGDRESDKAGGVENRRGLDGKEGIQEAAREAFGIGGQQGHKENWERDKVVVKRHLLCCEVQRVVRLLD
jgi:hypothetical protein